MPLLKLSFDGFDWDVGNSPKITRRVPKETIESFFSQPLLVKRDLRHSVDEERMLAIGHTLEGGRCLLVAFTIRVRLEMVLIRPISARYTHKKEEDAYAREIQTLQERE